MRDTISIRIPDDVTADQAVRLVQAVAGVATRRAQDRPATAPRPTGAVNPCEDEGCEWIDTIVDEHGVKWHVYDCEGVAVPYRA